MNDNPQNSLEKQLDTLDIKLIQLKENRGFAGAVNSGIHSAHSDYILLLNDDVLLQDESFLHAVDDFKKFWADITNKPNKSTTIIIKTIITRTHFF